MGHIGALYRESQRSTKWLKDTMSVRSHEKPFTQIPKNEIQPTVGIEPQTSQHTGYPDHSFNQRCNEKNVLILSR